MSGRTSQEREAARTERERRRGAGQPAASGMPRSPATAPRRRRPPGRIVLLLIVPALLTVALAWFVLSLFTPFKGEGSGTVVVRIPAGTGAGDVGDLLAAKGVVGSGFFFGLRATLAGERDELRAGTHRLRRDMSNGAALKALTSVPAAAPVIDLTIPEGPSRRELAARVAAAGVSGGYVEASERSPVLDPRDYGAPKGASLEGFLFPATYELRRGASARRLVRDQVEAFRGNFAGVDLSYARRRNLTRHDVLTIASMVERETAVPRERRLVAAVIYNRLKRGIPLGIDATTRYAVGNWTRPLTVSQLRSDSPYNTRNRKGLPPGPIGNPGLASIRAAARPARAGYLFYVVKPCGNGAHSFSRTHAEFQRDVAAYEAARAKNGGNDPSECG